MTFDFLYLISLCHSGDLDLNYIVHMTISESRIKNWVYTVPKLANEDNALQKKRLCPFKKTKIIYIDFEKEIVYKISNFKCFELEMSIVLLRFILKVKTTNRKC